MNFRKEIEKILRKEVKLKEYPIEVPKDTRMGDFAFPCFMLAKEFKKSPLEISRELTKKLKPTKYIEKIIASGPYVNFFISKEILIENTLKKIFKEKEKYGDQNIQNGNIVIEYPAPNTNKPLHLGHVRNMVLGYSVSKLLRKIGNKVHEVNLVNDRGIHICKSMLAYQKWGDKAKPNIKSDHFVGKYYVKYNTKLKKNPQLEAEAQDMLNDWERGDKKTLALWKKMNKWALKGFDETFKKFNLKFEQVYFESDIYRKGKLIVKKGFDKGVFEKNEEGAVFANLEQYKMPNKYLLRSDGTSIYITQDIYLAQAKIKDFKADSSIYVVGSEQNLHFRQLFKIMEMLGINANYHHLTYGMVYLPEGKMKSREGTVVDADEIVAEMEKLASREIKKRHKLKEKDLIKRSNQIGMGALRFFMLKNDPTRDMTYDPKQSISFEGETGPYVQYAHARCCSILDKYDKKVNNNVEYALLKGDNEIITNLSQFLEVIEKAAVHHKPSTIAHYLIELAQKFNEFYHHNPVISEDIKLTEARIMLIDCVRQVLENGLLLLGIESPSQM